MRDYGLLATMFNNRAEFTGDSRPETMRPAILRKASTQLLVASARSGYAHCGRRPPNCFGNLLAERGTEVQLHEPFFLNQL